MTRNHTFIHFVSFAVIVYLMISAAKGQISVPHDPKFHWQVALADSDQERDQVVLTIAQRPEAATAVTDAEVWTNLTAFEGYKLKPYADGIRGAVSVGIGHCLTAHHEVIKSSYTSAEVKRFFVNDLAIARIACRIGVERFDELPKDVQLVCIGLVFTCGTEGFFRFKDLRNMLNYRAWNASAAELADSKWYKHDVGAARANWAYSTLKNHGQ